MNINLVKFEDIYVQLCMISPLSSTSTSAMRDGHTIVTYELKIL